MASDRFDYAFNLERAGSYSGLRGAFWPPVNSYQISCLDLAAHTPDVGADVLRGLATLRCTIEAEWRSAKENGPRADRRFAEPEAVAKVLREVGDALPGRTDRRAAALRASAVADGYEPAVLQELAALEEDVAVVAGQVSTWYGKEPGGLPTAFACRRDPVLDDLVARAQGRRGEVADYLVRLHADLRLGDPPVFVPTELFFMAGEGDLHPKHIAYFLPEDEGVRHSPFNKTYYFANTHRALREAVSAPLAARLLTLDAALEPPAAAHLDAIPALGVLGHEFGHSVRRPVTDFAALHDADRWASAVLQETSADVFGVLILADVWAGPLGVRPADVVAYYLAECLRYVDRGLGHFPDSDGMFLQLSYLVQLGALAVEHGRRPRLAGDPETVLAGLRSLARTLADTLLTGTAEPAAALHRAYGPATVEPLQPLVEELRRLPSRSVEYVQEHSYAPVGSAS
jgi:hypothetical protein